MTYSPEEQQAYLAYLDAKAKMEGINPVRFFEYGQSKSGITNSDPMAVATAYANGVATKRNNRETEKWYQDFKNAAQLKALQEAGGNNANGSVNTSMGNGTVTMSGGTVPTGDSMIANNSLGNLFKDGTPTVSMSGGTVPAAAMTNAAGTYTGVGDQSAYTMGGAISDAIGNKWQSFNCSDGTQTVVGNKPMSEYSNTPAQVYNTGNVGMSNYGVGTPTVSMSGDSTVSPAATGMAAGAALSGLGNFLGLRNGSGNYFPMNNSDTINTGVSDPQGLGQTKGLSYNQKVDALTQAAAQQRLNDTGTSFDNVLNGDNATSQQQAAYNTLINNNATTNSANPTIPVTVNQQPAVSTGNGTTNQQTETATTSTQPAATVTPAAAIDTQSQSKISQVLGNTSNTQGNINDPLSSYWSKANFDGRLIDQGVKNPFLRDIMYDRMVVPMQLQAHQDRLNNAMKVYLDKNATDEQKENAKAIIAIETQKPTMWEDRDLMLKEMELKDQYTRSRTNANNGKSYSGNILADAFNKKIGQDGTINGKADCIGQIGDVIRENGYEWTDSRRVPVVVDYAKGRHLWDEGATNYNIGDIVVGDAGTGQIDGHAAMYVGNGKFTYVAGSEGNTIATKTNPFNSVYGVIRTSMLGGSREGSRNGTRDRTPGTKDKAPKDITNLGGSKLKVPVNFNSADYKAYSDAFSAAEDEYLAAQKDNRNETDKAKAKAAYAKAATEVGAQVVPILVRNVKQYGSAQGIIQTYDELNNGSHNNGFTQTQLINTVAQAANIYGISDSDVENLLIAHVNGEDKVVPKSDTGDNDYYQITPPQDNDKLKEPEYPENKREADEQYNNIADDNPYKQYVDEKEIQNALDIGKQFENQKTGKGGWFSKWFDKTYYDNPNRK